MNCEAPPESLHLPCETAGAGMQGSLCAPSCCRVRCTVGVRRMLRRPMPDPRKDPKASLAGPFQAGKEVLNWKQEIFPGNPAAS